MDYQRRLHFQPQPEELHQPQKITKMLSIKAEKSKADQALDFCFEMYDGKNMKLPLRVQVLFVPIYKTPLADIEWRLITCDHEDWNENEMTVLVTGLQDLGTKVRLAKHNQQVSLCTIILLLPACQGGEQTG